MSEWISVKDRLPDFHKRVLVVARPNLVVIAERGTLLKDVEWHWHAEGGSMFLHDVCTHWMPLPAPPTPDLTIEEALKEAVMDLSLFVKLYTSGTEPTQAGISAARDRVVRYREALERAGKW